MRQPSRFSLKTRNANLADKSQCLVSIYLVLAGCTGTCHGQADCTPNRLLVVDDDETSRFMLRLLLEGEGADVAEAEDGEMGVSTAMGTGGPFDMVFMDMRMPVKDGLEAARELRARGYSRPIVTLTANAFSRDLEACLAAGMNDHLSKPVKIDELVDTVRRHNVG